MVQEKQSVYIYSHKIFAKTARQSKVDNIFIY